MMISVTIGNNTRFCRAKHRAPFDITILGFPALASEPYVHLSAYTALH
jgi:hypothetical protein